MGLLNSLSNAWDSASRVVQGRPSREQEAAAERQNEHNQFVRQERTRRANLSNQQRLNEDVRAYIRPGNTANSEETEIYNRYAAPASEGGYGAELPPVAYHYIPNSGDLRNQLRAQGIDINMQDGNAMVFETGNAVTLNGQRYPVLSTSPFGNGTQIIQTPAGLRIREAGSEQFNLILPTDVRNTLTAAGITDFNGITELSGNTTLGGRSVRIATLRDGSAIALGQGNNSLQYKPAGNSQFINIREALSNTGMTQTEQRLQLNTETLGGAAGVTIRTAEGTRIWVSGDNQSVRVRAPGQNQYFSLSEYRTQRGLSQRLTADLKLDTGSMPYIEGQAEEDEIGRYKYLSAADGSRVRVAVGPDGRLTLQPPLPGETHEQYDARMDLIQSIIGGQIDTINQDARTQAAEEAREQLRQDQAQSHYQQSRNFFANPGSATLGFLQDTGNTVGDVVNYALRDPLSAFRDSWISTGEAVVSLGQASWQGAQGWWDDVQQVTPQIANGIQQANANQAQRSPLEQALRTTAQVVSVTNPALGAVINPLLTTPEQRQQQAELFSYAALDMPEAASEAFLQDPLNNFPVLFGGLMVNQAGNVLPTATFRELGRQQVLSQTNLVDVTLGRYGYNSTFEAQERINALEDADQRILGATVSDAVNLVGELAFAAPPPTSALSSQADNVLLRPSQALPDDYRLLGLEPGASLDEIRTAYRQQARQYHPDTGGATANPDRFTQLTEAYDRLRAQSQVNAAPTSRAAQPPVQTDPVQEHPQPEAQSSGTEPVQTEVSSEAGIVLVAPSGLSVVEPVISTLAPVFTTQLPDAVPAFTLPQVLTQLGQVNSVLGQQLTFSQQLNGLGELGMPPADLNSPVLAPVGQGTPPTASSLGQPNPPSGNPAGNSLSGNTASGGNSPITSTGGGAPIENTTAQPLANVATSQENPSISYIQTNNIRNILNSNLAMGDLIQRYQDKHQLENEIHPFHESIHAITDRVPNAHDEDLIRTSQFSTEQLLSTGSLPSDTEVLQTYHNMLNQTANSANSTIEVYRDLLTYADTGQLPQNTQVYPNSWYQFFRVNPTQDLTPYLTISNIQSQMKDNYLSLGLLTGPGSRRDEVQQMIDDIAANLTDVNQQSIHITALTNYTQSMLVPLPDQVVVREVREVMAFYLALQQQALQHNNVLPTEWWNGANSIIPTLRVPTEVEFNQQLDNLANLAHSNGRALPPVSEDPTIYVQPATDEQNPLIATLQLVGQNVPALALNRMGRPEQAANFIMSASVPAAPYQDIFAPRLWPSAESRAQPIGIPHGNYQMQGIQVAPAQPDAPVLVVYPGQLDPYVNMARNNMPLVEQNGWGLVTADPSGMAATAVNQQNAGLNAPGPGLASLTQDAQLIDNYAAQQFPDSPRIAVAYSRGGFMGTGVFAQNPGWAGLVIEASPASLQERIIDSGLSEAPLIRNLTQNVEPYYNSMNNFRTAINNGVDPNTPILIIHGAEDTDVDPRHMELLAQAARDAGFTNVTTQLIPNYGHRLSGLATEPVITDWAARNRIGASATRESEVNSIPQSTEAQTSSRPSIQSINQPIQPTSERVPLSDTEFNQLYAINPHPTSPNTLSVFDRVTGDPIGSSVLSIYDEGEYLLNGRRNGRQIAKIESIYISDEQLRGQGIGGRLLDAHVAQLQREGYSRIIVTAKRDDLRAFYLRHGFYNPDPTMPRHFEYNPEIARIQRMTAPPVLNTAAEVSEQLSRSVSEQIHQLSIGQSVPLIDLHGALHGEITRVSSQAGEINPTYVYRNAEGEPITLTRPGTAYSEYIPATERQSIAIQPGDVLTLQGATFTFYMPNNTPIQGGLPNHIKLNGLMRTNSLQNTVENYYVDNTLSGVNQLDVDRNAPNSIISQRSPLSHPEAGGVMLGASLNPSRTISFLNVIFNNITIGTRFNPSSTNVGANSTTYRIPTTLTSITRQTINPNWYPEQTLKNVLDDHQAIIERDAATQSNTFSVVNLNVDNDLHTHELHGALGFMTDFEGELFALALVNHLNDKKVQIPNALMGWLAEISDKFYEQHNRIWRGDRNERRPGLNEIKRNLLTVTEVPFSDEYPVQLSRSGFLNDEIRLNTYADLETKYQRASDPVEKQSLIVQMNQLYRKYIAEKVKNEVLLAGLINTPAQQAAYQPLHQVLTQAADPTSQLNAIQQIENFINQNTPSPSRASVREALIRVQAFSNLLEGTADTNPQFFNQPMPSPEALQREMARVDSQFPSEEEIDRLYRTTNLTPEYYTDNLALNATGVNQ